MAGDDTRESRLSNGLISVLGWWPAACAILIWIVAVAWPMLALSPTLARSVIAEELAPITTNDAISPNSLNQLFAVSLGWSAAVAVGAAILGWLPGRLLGTLLQRRGFVPAAALVIVPVCLPAYLIFYAWWQSWPAGTALHRWVIEHHAMQIARDGTLYLGMVCWSWPLVALCVAGPTARRPRSRDDQLAIDGATRVHRVKDRLRTDAPGLIAGMLLVGLTTLNNTTCFDLAEVFTFANELRARAALGATPTQMLEAGVPMVAIAICGATFAWWRLGRRAPEASSGATAPARVDAAALTLIWCASVLLPLGLFWRGMSVGGGGTANAVSEFLTLYVGNMLWTVGLALASGFAAAMATFGLAMMWHSDRLGVRLAVHAVSLSWLMWSLLPGTILGLALQAAWNRGALASLVFGNPVILNLAHLSSAGFVAVLLARWSVSGEPRSLHDLRRIDGAQGLTGLWQSARPPMLAAALASAAIVTVLSVGEVAVTAQVMPPMRIEQMPLAMTLLNDMHYQRPQTVLVAAMLLLILSLIASFAAAMVWRLTRGGGRQAGMVALAGVMATMLMMSGCDKNGEAEPLDVEYMFGSPGAAMGQFGYPRCIDVDPARRCVYVIDKTARVQRFDYDGHAEIEWHMPEMQQGKPTGVSVGPDGHVYVADTHYFRVMEYDADGREIRRFGSYGEGPGQFIYVTDIAFGPDGRLYVSEYGGNDRIQVFSPAGEYLFEFGSFGKGEGQFARPQSLEFSRDGRELYITDACNHRIVVTDPNGHWLRTFGTAGRGVGQLAYPYGLEVLPDDTLLVAEFGNNRIQRFDSNGRSLGAFGAVGRGEGEVQYPWAVAAADDRIFVLDSGNNRVQVIDEF